MSEQISLARHYLEIERPERALELLARALHDDPKNVELHELRASGLLDAERPAEAAEAARAGLRTLESIILLDVLAGEPAQGCGSARRRARCSRRCGSSRRTRSLSHYALVLGEGGVEEKAMSTLARAEAIAPDDLAVMKARVALAYLFGRDREASRQGKELLEESPEDPFAHSILGSVASGRGSARTARRHFDELARHDVTDDESVEIAL